MKKLTSVQLLTVVLGAMTPTLAHAQIYVATATGKVEEYDSSGNDLGTFIGSGLNGPTALAFDSSGNLFVANYGNNTVGEFGQSGNLIQTFSTGLSNPSGLAFDSSGDLFVANDANNTVGAGTIEEFAYTSGSLSTSGTTFKSGLTGTYGLAFDGGNLFVASITGNTVAEFNSSGTLITTLTGLNSPWGLAFDTGGNLYAANSGNGTIEEFASAGSGTVSGTGTSFGSMAEPAGVAFDNINLTLYVTDFGGDTVQQFDSSKNQSLFASTGSSSFPAAVASKPVPEPSTWALLTMGATALLGLRRRQTQLRSLAV
jgi:PEP-CTERM motif/NHL repeat